MSKMDCQLIGKKLCVGGFLYIHSKDYGSTTYWQCEQNTSQATCSARAITVGSGAAMRLKKGPSKSPHTHQPNINATQAQQVIVQVKRKAIDEPECPPSKIIRDESLVQIMAFCPNFQGTPTLPKQFVECAERSCLRTPVP